MGHYQMDNGEYFMRRPWEPGDPIVPRERPEPEDTTGLKMLEEFLAKRKQGDGNA